jgi:hypothetical protein
MQQTNNFLGLVLDVMVLGSELSVQAKKGEKHFFNYCIKNKDAILDRLKFYQEYKNNYESFLKSDFIKNNFLELSDYVMRYYDETK